MRVCRVQLFTHTPTHTRTCHYLCARVIRYSNLCAHEYNLILEIPVNRETHFTKRLVNQVEYSSPRACNFISTLSAEEEDRSLFFFSASYKRHTRERADLYLCRTIAKNLMRRARGVSGARADYTNTRANDGGSYKESLSPQVYKV